MRILIRVLAFHLLFASLSFGSELKTKSPDNKNVLIIKINSQKENALFYSVASQGIIIKDSPLGLVFENEPALFNNLQIISSSKKVVNEPWIPLYGEKKEYGNHYNETTVNFKESKTPFRNFSLIIRASM